MAEYAIAAHETTYNGVRFRSRHEATWAAFFTLGGWAWDYEPIDLVGWSPDFRLSHPEHLPEPTYVEVKPTWPMAVERGLEIRKAGHFDIILLADKPGIPGNDWTNDPGSAICFSDKPGYEMGLWVGEHRVDAFLTRNALLEYWWREAGNHTRWSKAA